MASKSLTHLELHRLRISKKQMLEVLTLVRNAKSLVFHQTSFRGRFEGIFNHPVPFTNLKRLTIFHSDPRIIRMISTTTLTEFTSVRDVHYLFTDQAINLIANRGVLQITKDEVNLMVQQQSLRSLKLRMTIDEMFFERIQEFTFKLKELSLFFTAEEEKIDPFLLQQKDSLEKLEVWNLSSPAFSFCCEMPNLRELSVPVLLLSSTTPAAINLERITSTYGPQPDAELFLQLHPKFKAFETDGLYFSFDCDVNTNLARIQVLSIPEHADFDADTVLPNLKELTLSRV